MIYKGWYAIKPNQPTNQPTYEIKKPRRPLPNSFTLLHIIGSSF